MTRAVGDVRCRRFGEEKANGSLEWCSELKGAVSGAGEPQAVVIV